MPNVVLTPKNSKGMKILPAFAMGCKGKTFHPKDIKKAGDSLGVYGVLYGQEECLKQAKDFWYIDNGYYGRSNPLGACNGYYRITHNAMYGRSLGDKPWDRFEKFGTKLEDWKIGEKIVLVPPSKYMGPVIGEEQWEDRVSEQLSKYTDRPIEISTKQNPMKWKNIWCIVTCISNVQTEALIKGYRVISTHFTNIGSLEDIENPPMDRQILADLAYQQWTVADMKSGKAWKELNSLAATA